MITPEIRERREKWANACMSGKYIQGAKCLRTLDNEYCCLGVAEEVANLNKWSSNEIAYTRTNIGERDVSWLLTNTVEWFGYGDSNPRAATAGQIIDLFREELTSGQTDALEAYFPEDQLSFSALNDSIKLSLTQIGKIIQTFHLE